jgi:cyclic pyranopterin phosphate synthase
MDSHDDAAVPNETSTPFSHLDASGAARMVDVSEKTETRRTARAAGHVRMANGTRDLIAARALPKGDVFTVARVAGILAAKRTAESIPLCHPLPLSTFRWICRSSNPASPSRRRPCAWAAPASRWRRSPP